MSDPTLSDVYKFVTVEEYFNDIKSWETLKTVSSLRYKPEEQTLVIEFKKSDTPSESLRERSVCVMLLQFVQNDTFRVRFNPKKNKEEDYTNNNTRALANDTFAQLKSEAQRGDQQFYIDYQDKGDQGSELTTKKKQNDESVIKVIVTKDPFKIEAINCELDGSQFKVWETSVPSILFTPNGNDDYAIIQAVKHPAPAKYIGFGEQGGKSLCRNSGQLNYFNFDNMRYRQVYNYGPLDGREPMYHSEPFFIEFNGVPEKDCVTGMTGAHRFAALWTGDNSSTWDFLKMNVTQVMSLGMSGVTICGQDVGGFEQENEEQHWVGPELMIRSCCCGSFLALVSQPLHA